MSENLSQQGHGQIVGTLLEKLPIEDHADVAPRSGII
jgi:hypothetical protein